MNQKRHDGGTSNSDQEQRSSAGITRDITDGALSITDSTTEPENSHEIRNEDTLSLLTTSETSITVNSEYISGPRSPRREIAKKYMKVFSSPTLPQMPAEVSGITSPTRRQRASNRINSAGALGYEIENLQRYRRWKGRNVFLCKGYLMLGVHIDHLGISIALISMTWILYVALLAPFTHCPGCFLLALLFFIINLLLLCSTAFTEPGIIPRRQPHFLTSTIQDQIQEKLQQYCTVCRIVRPARAKHCRHCDNCVIIFDHHCPVSFPGYTSQKKNLPNILISA